MPTPYETMAFIERETTKLKAQGAAEERERMKELLMRCTTVHVFKKGCKDYDFFMVEDVLKWFREQPNTITQPEILTFDGEGEA